MNTTAATQGFSMHKLFDGAAITASFASALHYLPPFTAVLSAIWLSIQLGSWIVKTGYPWIKEKVNGIFGNKKSSTEALGEKK
jgi:hypothetical protein